MPPHTCRKPLGTDALVDELLAGAGLLDAAVQALALHSSENFAADPRSVSASRRFVTATLEEWNQRPLIDTITLLLSELVTNAVVHANTAPDVTVRFLPDRVHVEVTDTQPDLAEAKQLDDESTGGRGLALVVALAMSWGNVTLPLGKIVWFDVAGS